MQVFLKNLVLMHIRLWMINRAISNDSSSYKNIFQLTSFVTFVDSTHHSTLCMEWTKKGHNVMVLYWILSLEQSDEDIHRKISHQEGKRHMLNRNDVR